MKRLIRSTLLACAGALIATAVTPAAQTPVSRRAQAIGLPSLTAGLPQKVTLDTHVPLPPPGGYLPRSTTRTLGAGGASVRVVHIRGVDGIEQAQGIPEGVRRLLALHVRTLPKGESDHYVVNIQQAMEWAKTHDVPADLQPTDVKTGDGHSGCKAWSIHCASESLKHAQDEANRQFDILRDQAQKDWKHAATELANTWHDAVSAVEGCLADHTLHVDNIPIKFSIAPEMGIIAETQGKTTDASASGKVTGTLGVSLPVDADFQASLDVFYIPCLPFIVRPKELGASGTMTVTSKVKASLAATGKFAKDFPIPPTGGPSIPVEIIPIVIAGVPVAELDISVYFDGGIKVGASGSLTASAEFDDPHESSFSFKCNGKGCGPGARPPATTRHDPTTTEAFKLAGKAYISPYIYAALEINFDFDAASVRAGPQPFLEGQVYGCDSATATQNLHNGSGTSAASYELVSDLDWQMLLRTDFLVGGNKEGSGYNPTLIGHQHIAFKDLSAGGSTALVASVTAPAAVVNGQPAAFKVKMPSCYQFTDKIHYQIAAVGGTVTCPAQSAPGACSGDPTKDLSFTATWPSAGSHTLTVVAVGDEHPRQGDAHQRKFNGVKPTTVTVIVK